MKRIRILIEQGLILLALVSHVAASGTSAGLLLTQGAGGRGQGMGETGAGTSGVLDTLYWNPAGLAAVSGLQLQTSYLAGVEGSAYQQINGAYAWNGFGTVAVGGSFLQGGMMELDREDGTLMNVQSESDWALALGYGTRVSQALRGGAVVKLLNSTLLETYTAQAAAVDFGLQADVASGLCFGVAVQNLGTALKYETEGDPLPLTLRAGGNYLTQLGTDQTLTLALDGVQPRDHDFGLHVGIEYVYAKVLAGRVGYKAGYDLEGFTAGLGVHWGVVWVDYAFALVSELSSTHRISLSLQL